MQSGANHQAAARNWANAFANTTRNHLRVMAFSTCNPDPACGPADQHMISCGLCQLWDCSADQERPDPCRGKSSCSNSTPLRRNLQVCLDMHVCYRPGRLSARDGDELDRIGRRFQTRSEPVAVDALQTSADGVMVAAMTAT